MADQPTGQGPINPVKSYGSGNPGSGTPANRNLQDAANSFSGAGKDAADNMDRLTDRLEKATRLTKDMEKQFGISADNLKHMIDYAEDMGTALKSWQSYTSRLAHLPGIFRESDRKSVIKFLDGFLAQSKRMMTERHFLNPAQQREIEKALGKTVDMMDELASSTDDAFDKAKVDEMNRAFQKVYGSVQKISAEIGKVPIVRLTQGFQNINKAIASTPFEKFSGVGKFLEKMKGARDLRTEMRNLVKEKRETTNVAFLAKQRELRGKLLAQGINLEKAGVKGYKFPRGRMGGRVTGSPEGFRRVAESLTPQGLDRGAIGTWVDKKLAGFTLRKIAESQATGEGMGAIPTFLLNKLKEGGGSITGGISTGAGGMLSEVAGKAAMPLAVLKLVQDAYDTNARRNRAVEQGVGQGGLFTGMTPGERATDRLSQFRQSINVQPLNELGMTYEKNLKMMQDIVSSGLTVGEVATRNKGTGKLGQLGKTFSGGNFADTTGTNPAQDFFTTISRNMYIGGAKLGIDPTTAVQMTVKLLTTYRQSFQQSEGFFARLDKETQAAGLTTGKYIEIIYALESQFDKLNRTFRDNVDTLAILGNTGMNTAEDLKDAFDTLTSKGQQRTLSQAAFINKDMLESGAGEQLAGRKSNTDAAAKALADTLKAQGVEVSAADLIKMQGNYSALMTRVNEAGVGKNEKQNIGGQMQELRQAQTQQELLARAMRTKDFVGMAAAQEVTGNDAATQMQQTLQSLAFALKKTGRTFADIGDVPGLIEAASGKVSPAILTALGSQKDLINKLPDIMQKTATTFTEQVHRGELTDTGYIATQARAIAPQIGLKLSGKETNEQVAQKMKEFVDASEENREAVSLALSKNEGFIMTAFGPGSPMKKATEAALNAPAETARNKQIAEDATTAARPTADIMSDAFEYLFQLLVVPLNKMVELLQMIAHVGDFSKSPAEVRADFSQQYTPDKIAATQKEYADDIKELSDSMEAMDPSSASYKAAQSRLQGMKTRQAQFASYAGGEAPSTQMGLDTATDLLTNPRGAYNMSEAGVSAAEQMKGTQQSETVARMLMNIGGTQVGDTDQVSVSAADRSNNYALIEKLKADNIIKEQGWDKGGRMTYTVNNFNVDQLRSIYSGGTNKSGEAVPAGVPVQSGKTASSSTGG
jgi:enamine deaminase RidA (YjgF/YER057c/UK114 family)